VAFQFQRKGYVKVALHKRDGDDLSERMDSLCEMAINCTAEDFEQVGSSGNSVEMEFTCPPNSLATLSTAVSAYGMDTDLLASELIYVPADTSRLPDEALEAEIEDLVAALEEDEDVLRVWTTLDT